MADTLTNTQGRVREWIGPRIIPVFADEVQWNIETNYDPLTMVQNAGETFMSRQYVPAGAPLPNTATGQESTDYWVHMSNWNAQIEGYREEVMQYAEQVLSFSGYIEALQDALPISEFDSTHTVNAAIDAINDALPITAFDSTNTISAAIASLNETFSNAISTITANGWVTTDRLNDSSVTTQKIADGAITNSKLASNSLSFNKFSDSEQAKIKTNNLKQRKIVCIGDSFTHSTHATSYWPTYLHNIFGATTYNFGVGGQGFVNNAGGTFATQLQNAIDSSSFDNDEITDIVVLGGYNDYAAAESALNSAVDSLIQTAKSNFPNATIYVGAMLKGIYPLDYAIGGASEAQYRSRFISTIEYHARVNGAIVIPSPWTWCMGETNWNVDNIHVNADGQRYIATCVAQVLCGSNPLHFKEKRITTSPSASISEVRATVMAHDGKIEIVGHFKASADVSGVSILELPEFAYTSASTTEYGSPYAAVSFVTDKDNNCMLVSNGTHLRVFNMVANQNIWVRTTYMEGI